MKMFEHLADDCAPRRVHTCDVFLLLSVGHEGASTSPRVCGGTRDAPERASSQHHMRPA